MSTVTIAVITTPVALPIGFTAGKLRISIVDLVSDDVDGTEAVFEDIPDGTYTARAVRLDSEGNELGGAIEQEFTVSAEPVEQFYDAPSALSVTVTP